MTTKSHNAKKPKLAGHADGQAPSAQTGSDAPTGDAPAKHKMSFAQHQHELQIEHTPTPMPSMETTGQHLKSDAQQHQQKSGSHK